MIRTMNRLREAVDKYSEKMIFIYGILTDEQHRLLDEWEESQ
jgi:hypothetical protein